MKAGSVLAALGLSLMIGGMVFFGAIIAPLVFTKLPPDISGPFIRAIFPRYYAFIAAAAFLGMIGFILRGETFSGFILLFVIAAVLWAWLWLIPHLNAWRDAGNMLAFDRGHKASTWLNGAELIAAAWLLLRLVL